MSSDSPLFTPIRLGDIQLEHRLAMAPLTRFRATEEHVHTDMAVEYYSQRCDTPGTLIITEATFISPQAGGYPNVPGIWNEDQIVAWKKIVDAVHAKGCKMVMQLWALGRASVEAQLTKEGPYPVVSSSTVGLTPDQESVPGSGTPVALSEAEIKEYVGWYAQAAKNFVEGAGGDGVEIHSANGYLIDQFLQTNSNKRTDNYGGSVENRTRFGLEVVAAVSAAIGQKKTGIRISPYSTFQGMKMPFADIQETFRFYVDAIKAASPELAYIHAVEPRIAGIADIEATEEETLDFLFDIWSPRSVLLAGGYKASDARRVASERLNTVVTYGRYFISTPDVVSRIKNNTPLNPYNRDTFYLFGPQHSEGYTDYPFAHELKN